MRRLAPWGLFAWCLVFAACGRTTRTTELAVQRRASGLEPEASPKIPLGVFQTELFAPSTGDFVSLALHADGSFWAYRCPDAACERPTEMEGQYTTTCSGGLNYVDLYQADTYGHLLDAGEYQYRVHDASVVIHQPTSARWNELDPIDESLCENTDGHWNAALGPSGEACGCGPGRAWSQTGCLSPGQPPPFDGPGLGKIHRFQDVRVVVTPVSVPISDAMTEASDETILFHAAGYNLELAKLSVVLADSVALARFAHDVIFDLAYDPNQYPLPGQAVLIPLSPAEVLDRLESAMHLDQYLPDRVPVIRAALSMTIDAMFTGPIFSDPSVRVYLTHWDAGGASHAEGVLAVGQQAGVVRAVTAMYP